MKTGKNIKGALNYNENKVRQGTAELILASNFSREVSEIGFSKKLERFQKIIGFSENVQVNTLHLSLNFSPDDHLDTETMQQIAADYMKRIGFAGQPYLVYLHDDTSHPHLHIVTTTIRPDGKPIYLHNIGKRLSEPARKAIEQEYGLIKAESRKKEQTLPLKPIPLQMAHYGKSETKRVISNIVREVVARYKFTSLHELNAILRQFNVMADRGSVSSRMYQNGGLVYSMVDKNGYKIGIPIKASSIFTNPTLSALERKFKQNFFTRPVFQKKLQAKVSFALARSTSRSQFMEYLKQRNIGCSVYYEKDGTIKDISFVDHNSKSVFSSKDLGISISELLNGLHHRHRQNDKITANKVLNDNRQNVSLTLENSKSFDLLKVLLTTQAYQPDLSPEFLKKRKKKRKR